MRFRLPLDRKTVNVRLLGILLAGLVVAGLILHGLHQWQVRRQAFRYLELARAANEEGESLEAVGHLQRYLQFRPDDTDARAEWGLLLADLNRYQEAYMALETVLRHDPRRTEVRRRLVDAESEDAADHVQLGRILAALGQRAKAEGRETEATQWLRRAEAGFHQGAKLDPSDPGPWTALLRFLAQNGRAEEAEKLLVEARGQIPKDRADFALARFHEAMGKIGDASKQYEALLSKAPVESAVLRRALACWRRSGQTRIAEQHLRTVLGDAQLAQADRTWARRQLIAVLSARGAYRDLTEAIGLCDENLGETDGAVEDRLSKAMLLAPRPLPDRRAEAVPLLEQLLAETSSAPVETRFRLAQLHRSGGNWPQYIHQMRRVLASHGDRRRYVAAHVEALLEGGHAGDAETWLRRLEEIAPKEFVTVALSARASVKKGNYKRAVDTLVGFHQQAKGTPESREALLRLAVKELEQSAGKLEIAGKNQGASELLQAAETMLRDHVKQHPEKGLLLAAFLGRGGRLGEALDRAERVASDASAPALAATASEILHGGIASPEHLGRLDAILRTAIERHGRSPRLLMTLGDLRIFQGRLDEAESLFREVLEDEPHDLPAKNNLAILIALRGERLDEAIDLIREAIARYGPLSVLLDSRAMVHLTRREFDKALADADAAIAQLPRPTRYFHKAQAFHGAGRRGPAVAAWEEALKLGLKPWHLHSLERPAYEKLLSAFQ